MFLPRDLNVHLEYLASFWTTLVLESDTHTIDTMPLIGRGGEPFTPENMAQMPTTVGTDDLLGRGVREPWVMQPDHCAGQTVEICRPAARGLELVLGAVQRCPTPRAVVRPCRWVVLVVLAGERLLRAFRAENPELLCDE